MVYTKAFDCPVYFSSLNSARVIIIIQRIQSLLEAKNQKLYAHGSMHVKKLWT